MAVVPVLLRALGREEFALWMAITSLLIATTFIDLGLGGSLVNRLSQPLRTPRDDGRAVSSSVIGLGIFWGSAALLLLALHPALDWNRMFGLAPGTQTRASPPAVLMLVSLCAMAPLGIVGRVRLALNQSHLQSLWDAISAVLALAGMLLIAVLGGDVTLVVLAHVSAVFLTAGANWAQLLRTRRWLTPRWRDASWAEFVSLLRQGGVFFSIAVCTAIAFGGDSLIAVSILGAKAAAEPMVALRLVTALQTLMAGMALPYWPRLSRAAASSAATRARALRETFVFIFLISAAAAVGTLFLGPAIVRLWTGGAVGLPAALALPISIWIFVFGLAQGLMTAFSVAHLVRTQLTIAAVSGVLILTCKISGALLLGAPGLVWGGVAALLCGSVVPLAFLLVRDLRRHDP
jgi:O-antigen/teichoic acid export membrane protein